MSIKKQKTALIDFCDFLEKEIVISMTKENWEIYYAQKKASLLDEREQIEDAYQTAFLNGISSNSEKAFMTDKQYFNQTFES